MTIRLACVVFDCSDAIVVGRFWSEALGRPLDTHSNSQFASIGFATRREADAWKSVTSEEDPSWVFATVPEHKMLKNRMHIDVVARDLESEIARLVLLGATRVADLEENGYRWTFMTDPEGNEFDLAREL